MEDKAIFICAGLASSAFLLSTLMWNILVVNSKSSFSSNCAQKITTDQFKFKNKNKWRRGNYVTMSVMTVRSKQLLTYITLTETASKILVQRILATTWTQESTKNEYLGSISIIEYYWFILAHVLFSSSVTSTSHSWFVLAVRDLSYLDFSLLDILPVGVRTYHILLLKTVIEVPIVLHNCTLCS